MRQTTDLEPHTQRAFTTRQLRTGRYTSSITIRVGIANISIVSSLNSNLISTHIRTRHRTVTKDISLTSRLTRIFTLMAGCIRR